MHRELYKLSFDRDDRQELRRHKLLQQQKLMRLEQQSERRELRHASNEKPCKISKHKQPTFQKLYGSDVSLQFSEWLREKPENLDDWILIPCAKGQRCLVVATGGQTKMFSKTGRFRMSFQSFLPGGGTKDVIRPAVGGFSILDCVYNANKDSFYVLDVLWYGKQCFLDCEAHFRFFWLKSKFEELNDTDFQISITSGNFKAFSLLNTFDLGNKVSTARAFQSYPLWSDNSPELDGYLFYHKESSYTCGPTPLVCWLFPFMVEDVLQMTVNSHYERPPNYSNPWLYMDDFDKELARKRQRQHTKQMDYESGTDSYNSSIISLSHIETEEMKGVVGDDVHEGARYDEEGDNDCKSLKKLMNIERMLELEGTTND